MDYFRTRHEDGLPTFFEKIASSLTAGAIGAFIGNPTDLVLVRFQADS